MEPDFKHQSDYPSFIYEGVYYKVGWIVLERTKGVRPAGMIMRHLCGNPRCCNACHLEWGTPSENVRDQHLHGTFPERRGRKNPNYRHGGYVK